MTKFQEGQTVFIAGYPNTPMVVYSRAGMGCGQTITTSCVWLDDWGRMQQGEVPTVALRVVEGESRERSLDSIEHAQQRQELSPYGESR
jgi:hypothetical protein